MSRHFELCINLLASINWSDYLIAAMANYLPLPLHLRHDPQPDLGAYEVRIP